MCGAPAHAGLGGRAMRPPATASAAGSGDERAHDTVRGRGPAMSAGHDR